MVGDFISDFWKILKVILKKILICEFFFSKFCDLLFVFFILLLFLKFYFQFRLCVLVKKILEIFIFFYFTDYRFYQRLLENSWIFIKKIEILYIQNIFRIPLFTICNFNFLVFLISFFFYFTCLLFSKKIVKFLCCFIVCIRDFIKKLRYLKFKISTKFHHFLFLFYFFIIFCILLSISRT